MALHFTVILGTMHIVQTHGAAAGLTQEDVPTSLQSCWIFLKHGWSAL